MADEQYAYTTVPNRMNEILERLPSLGRPSNVTQDWFRGQGYTSGNDMTVLATMRRIGIIGSSGEPTDFYDAIRAQDGARVAEHVRAAYRELFDLYPDAHQKDAEALRNFFRAKTSAGQTAQRLMVRTFQVLAELGDFSAAAPAPSASTRSRSGKERESSSSRDEKSGPGRGAGGLTLNVNIQLQLPASAEGDVYDKFFEAMAKHLKGLASLE